jgi:hypothetical protein
LAFFPCGDAPGGEIFSDSNTPETTEGRNLELTSRNYIKKKLELTENKEKWL